MLLLWLLWLLLIKHCRSLNSQNTRVRFPKLYQKHKPGRAEMWLKTIVLTFTPLKVNHFPHSLYKCRSLQYSEIKCRVLSEYEKLMACWILYVITNHHAFGASNIILQNKVVMWYTTLIHSVVTYFLLCYVKVKSQGQNINREETRHQNTKLNSPIKKRAKS